MLLILSTKCKIKHLVIPDIIVDFSANFAIMTNDIVKWLKLKIDISERYDLKGIATFSIESLGTARNVPVYFTSECTIYSDFTVIKNHLEKLILILPNTLLDKYNYDLLASKAEIETKM